MENPILMESSPAAIAPLILRNFLTSVFMYTDKSLLNLGDRFRFLGFLRYLLVSAFFFFLGILPSFFPTLNPSHQDHHIFPYRFSKADDKPAFKNQAGDSSVARALSQLLSLMNDIPVSSRKYELVRLLAEKVINDNILENCAVLEDVNRIALSAAFSRTLLQLEARATMIDDDNDSDHNGGENAEGSNGNYNKLSRILRVFWYCMEAAWSRLGLVEVNRCGKSAEKLAAELLWLAQKLAKCGNVDEAVYKWASASKLAWLALSAEPRLQCSLVKVSVFLFKQAKEMGSDQEDEEEKKEHTKKTKLKLLMSWLPLLCRASNGTDTPVLSFNEKAEVERVLEEIIESLSDKEQENVLSLWLHHFIHCPTSDWPNLHDCYSRWCTNSRRDLILQ